MHMLSFVHDTPLAEHHDLFAQTGKDVQRDASGDAAYHTGVHDKYQMVKMAQMSRASALMLRLHTCLCRFKGDGQFGACPTLHASDTLFKWTDQCRTAHSIQEPPLPAQVALFRRETTSSVRGAVRAVLFLTGNLMLEENRLLGCVPGIQWTRLS